MEENGFSKLEEHFCTVSDPRIERIKEHKLIDIIALAICAVICGAEGWVDIENFENGKLTWCRNFLKLYGILLNFKA